MKVSPPDGRVSANAVPWAQVSIDGNAVGETPLANLPLAVGEHEIVFRHPQLGEQTQKVIVKSNALTRVSAILTR
jgi:serine/threonine-protein kinase